MPVLDRLTASDGALLVVDVQEKLLRADPGPRPPGRQRRPPGPGGRAPGGPRLRDRAVPQGARPDRARAGRPDPRPARQDDLPLLRGPRDRRGAGGPGRPPRHAGRDRGPRLRRARRRWSCSGWATRSRSRPTPSARGSPSTEEFALRRLERAGAVVSIDRVRPLRVDRGGRAPEVQGDQRPGQGAAGGVGRIDGKIGRFPDLERPALLDHRPALRGIWPIAIGRVCDRCHCLSRTSSSSLMAPSGNSSVMDRFRYPSAVAWMVTD